MLTTQQLVLDMLRGPESVRETEELIRKIDRMNNEVIEKIIENNIQILDHYKKNTWPNFWNMV